MIVRGDLPHGLQAAQAVHATGESCTKPHVLGTYAVVLTVANEAEIRALSRRLGMAGVVHALVIENDAPYQGQAMAIGIRPEPRSTLKRYLRGLRLLT